MRNEIAALLSFDAPDRKSKGRKTRKIIRWGRDLRSCHKVFSIYSDSLSASAINILSFESKGASFPAARPTPNDFRCDVDLASKLVVKGRQRAKVLVLARLWDSESETQSYRLAQKVLGKGWNETLQRLGEIFVRRGLHKGYFQTLRKPVGDLRRFQAAA